MLHFGTLYGVGHLINAVIGSLQYGLFAIAEDALGKDPFWVSFRNCCSEVTRQAWSCYSSLYETQLARSGFLAPKQRMQTENASMHVLCCPEFKTSKNIISMTELYFI
jgi:hypothetical protein